MMSASSDLRICFPSRICRVVRGPYISAAIHASSISLPSTVAPMARSAHNTVWNSPIRRIHFSLQSGCNLVAASRVSWPFHTMPHPAWLQLSKSLSLPHGAHSFSWNGRTVVKLWGNWCKRLSTTRSWSRCRYISCVWKMEKRMLVSRVITYVLTNIKFMM